MALPPVAEPQRNEDQIAARAWRLRARTSRVTALLLAKRMLILLEIRQSHTRLASFFGEGMARAPGAIAADPPPLRSEGRLPSCRSWASGVTVVDHLGGGC